jgi:hypothetical protein
VLRRRGRLVIVWLALGALSSGACAKAGEAGLQVKGYAADVVFAKRKTPTTPVVAAIPPTLTPEQAIADVPLPEAAPPSFTPPAKYVGPPIVARPACRAATPGATAAPAALTVPDGVRPETGQYRWNKSGSFALVGPQNATFPVGGFEQRKIRNVVERSAGVFTFETLQPDLNGRYIEVIQWQVKPNAVAERQSALSVSASAGDPERGLAIKAIDWISADGKPVAGATPFHPLTALLVLPLPIVPGEQVNSAAIDPTNAQAVTYQATVGARDRVDACGEFVEGWKVSGTMSWSGGTPYTYELWAAPQFGAIPILERLQGTTTSAAGSINADVTWKIGQLHPSAAAV